MNSKCEQMVAVDKHGQALSIGDLVKVSNRDWKVVGFTEDPDGAMRPLVKLIPAPDGFIYRYDQEVELI